MAIDALAVARRIQEARETAGMTQQEMADFLHVKVRTYQNYESQSQRLVRVPFRLIDQIAEITETRSEWLLHGTQTAQDPERLDKIEAMLAEILARLNPPDEDEPGGQVGPRMPTPPPGPQLDSASDEPPKRHRKTS